MTDKPAKQDDVVDAEVQEHSGGSASVPAEQTPEQDAKKKLMEARNAEPLDLSDPITSKLSKPFREDEIQQHSMKGWKCETCNTYHPALYVSWNILNDRLDDVFGIGNWRLMPIQKGWDQETDTVLYEGWLSLNGKYASEASGSLEYHDGSQMDKGDAMEAAKSFCLMRCCKPIMPPLRKLWRPSFQREWFNCGGEGAPKKEPDDKLGDEEYQKLKRNVEAIINDRSILDHDRDWVKGFLHEQSPYTIESMNDVAVETAEWIIDNEDDFERRFRKYQLNQTALNSEKDTILSRLKELQGEHEVQGRQDQTDQQQEEESDTEDIDTHEQSEEPEESQSSEEQQEQSVDTEQSGKGEEEVISDDDRLVDALEKFVGKTDHTVDQFLKYVVRRKQLDCDPDFDQIPHTVGVGIMNNQEQVKADFENFIKAMNSADGEG